MVSQRLVVPYGLHCKGCRDLDGWEIRSWASVWLGRQLEHLFVVPLILDDNRLGQFQALGGKVPILENLQHHIAIAQRQSTIVSVTPESEEWSAYKVVYEEVFHLALALAADDGIGLEQKHMVSWCQLLPDPRGGQESRNGGGVFEFDVGAERDDRDLAGLEESLECGGFEHGQIDHRGISEQDDGPFGAEDGGEVQDQRYEVVEGSVLDDSCDLVALLSLNRDLFLRRHW